MLRRRPPPRPPHRSVASTERSQRRTCPTPSLARPHRGSTPSIRRRPRRSSTAASSTSRHRARATPASVVALAGLDRRAGLLVRRHRPAPVARYSSQIAPRRSLVNDLSHPVFDQPYQRASPIGSRDRAGAQTGALVSRAHRPTSRVPQQAFIVDAVRRRRQPRRRRPPRSPGHVRTVVADRAARRSSCSPCSCCPRRGSAVACRRPQTGAVAPALNGDDGPVMTSSAFNVSGDAASSSSSARPDARVPLVRPSGRTGPRHRHHVRRATRPLA